MLTDRVELFIQGGDVAGQEERLVRVLQELPGVRSVGTIAQDDISVEAKVEVEFDPEETNPLLMRDALEEQGFTILSAAEEPEGVEEA